MNPATLVILLLISGFSCRPKASQDAAVSTTARADSAALLVRPGPDAPRTAADRLVRALYFEHNKTDNPFREKNRALIDQFFAKPTADLIWNDAKNTGSANNLLFNAPDRAVRKTWVEPAAVAGSRAVVYVTFLNDGKPEEVRLELQQLAGRWRIADLFYPDDKRLTQLLRP